LSSPGSLIGPPSSPVNDNDPDSQAPRRPQFRCTQCPNRSPFRLQSQLT
jgi:hypothetical protein